MMIAAKTIEGHSWNRRSHYLTHRFDLLTEGLHSTLITAIRAAKADGGWEWRVIDNRGGSPVEVGRFAKRADALAAGEGAL